MTHPPLNEADVLDAGGLFAGLDPAYEVRPQQQRFAQALGHACDVPGGANVLAELPTGTGKSRGALVPPLLRERTIRYATATRGLQGQLRDRDVPYLDRALREVLGHEIRAVVVKGRGAYVCLRALGELEGPGGVAFTTPEAHEEWRVLAPWVRETPDGDLDAAPVPPGPELRERLTVDDEACDHGQCPLYRVCYVTRAREAAAAPGVVQVVNHHLLLHHEALRRRTGGKAGILGGPRPDVLLLDEAHALPEAGRDVLGEELRFGYGRRVAPRLRRLAAESGVGEDAEDEALAVQAFLDAWAAHVAPRVREAERRTGRAELLLGDERALADPVAAAANALAAACRSAAARLERGVARAVLDDAEEPTTGPLADAARWRRRADGAGRFAGVVRLVATPPEAGAPDADGDAFLRRALLEGTGARRRLLTTWTPVDVSGPLGTLLWDGTAAPVVAAFSATLATAPRGPDRLAYFRRECGIPAGTPERAVLELVEDSAFAWHENARLYVSPPAAVPADRERDRGAFDAQLAAEVARVLLATGGRALVLFTSVRSMEAVAEAVAPRLPPAWRVFRQGAAPRSVILEAFDAPGQPPVVAFCTRGYWEGTDVRGLHAVVIDRLPFEPPDDALHGARCRRAERATGDRWAGWAQVTFPQMLLHLRQGVGRLLRTRRDRGVVALLDSRVLSKGYGRRIVGALPEMPRVRDAEAIRRFLRGPP